ncbi:MAG: xanthine dehydrogenase family protein molybdopterin-binding subunit [Burkholderiales bacterium]|nr:xanthine dehydrogenase family protein molybdopterin-binding subunit [Burkholderiales bacterium]
MTTHPEGIGASVLRREDRRFLTGRGQFVADMLLEGQLFCAFVRSPHAHARVGGIDVGAAIAMPGVVAVFTGADMAADRVGPMIPLWQIPGADGRRMNEPPRWALSRGTVRHVGEAVAIVIAATRHQALDAAEAVAVEYTVLPATVDLRDAVKPGAPQLHPEAPGNLCVRFERGAKAPVDAAFAAAAHSVEVDIVNHRIICAALEPRAVVALASASGGLDGHAVTIWSTTQVPHHIRKLVAEQLALPENAVRVISPDVGGGFGTKGKHYPEEIILAWAAIKLQRPLKWVSTRSEAFVSDYQARDHVTRAELALDAEGRFLGARVSTLAAVGAYVSTVGAAVPTTVYTAVLSGPYRIPAIHAEVRALFTNTVPTDAYRGAGRPEACYVLERLVEEASARLGIDRLELRRRNFIAASAMPYSTPVGPTYDTGDFRRLFDRVLVLADHAGFPARRAAAEEKGLLRGFGACYFVESSGVAPSKYAGVFGARVGFFDSADIRVAADGSLLVMCGTHSHGQAHATTFPQVLADKIGVPLAMIELVEGDTGRVPYGTGTFGSRSMVIAGSAIVMAADKLLAKARRMAAHMLEAAEPDVLHRVVKGMGEFRVAGTDRKVGWPEVARAVTSAHSLPPGMEPVLHENAFFDPSNLTWSNGAQACEVEIDPATGETRLMSYVVVDDVGTVINPMVVEGQVHGAIAQGIGQALYEAAAYDRLTGQLYSGSFMDYTLPRAHFLPMFVTETDESQPCTHNPLGAKGCGESGTIGAPAAITSAMKDALAPIGVTGLEMPYTRSRVWQAIRAASPARAAA